MSKKTRKDNVSFTSSMSMSAFIARPIIQWDHADGPLLTWAGCSHWLTWWERIQLALGLTDEEKLGNKLFNRPLKFDYKRKDEPRPACPAGRPADCNFSVVQQDREYLLCSTCGAEWEPSRSGDSISFRKR